MGADYKHMHLQVCELDIENIVTETIFHTKYDNFHVWISTITKILHQKELCNLYTSPNITVMKSRRMRWTGHV